MTLQTNRPHYSDDVATNESGERVRFNDTMNKFLDDLISAIGVLQDAADVATTSYIDVTGGHATYGTLAGAVDSVNQAYTVAQGSYEAGTIEIYYNGQLQTDFVETTPASGVVTLGFAPLTGNDVLVKYEKI